MGSIRDFAQDQELIVQFLKEFSHVDEDGQPVPKYKDILTKLANREEIHLYVDLMDVEKFNQELADQIQKEGPIYTKIFLKALDEILPHYKTSSPATKDTMDVFIEQRLFVAERNAKLIPPAPGSQKQHGSAGRVDLNCCYPADLTRRFEVSFKPNSFAPIPMRKILADCIGHLVTVRGIVTRVSDVKSMMKIPCYTCELCGSESFQELSLTSLDYTPLFICSSPTCKSNKVQGALVPQIRGSKFIKSQEIRLQEHSDQMPEGHVPRSMQVFARGELVRSCDPGDHISVTGVFLPLDRSAYRMRNSGLATETFIDAHYITLMNKTEDDEMNVEPLSMAEALELAHRGGSNFLGKLASSIAPEIYGLDNIKKSLLLLLVGGVDVNPRGMKIRGNINICIMGDPGVAKSQLLGFIDRLAPRSCFTTGRGSSGVGLTAAVLKDPLTNELVLEGGALVLSDGGVCCIDEFDKMMDADRTAIHEVMEQQTVSIAKAGIMTTLNARVSILAAANPADGRYNVHRSITDNLELPAALMSRFDLIWLVRDTPETRTDLNLASHVTSIHRNPDKPAHKDVDAIDMKTMRRYISLCKQKNPTIPKNLSPMLEQAYLDLRARKRIGNHKDSLFTSPRSLLAIIRLTTAFARLRLADVVEEADIKAAVDLYNNAVDSIEGFKNSNLGVIDVLRTMSKTFKKNEFALEEVYSECLAADGWARLTEKEISKHLDMLCEEDMISMSNGMVTLIN